jgi:hypothetical protein
MTAPAPPALSNSTPQGLLDQAVEVRREWLQHGLSTEPADRAAAEDAIGRVYALHRRPRPRFVWVASPHQALPLLGGLPNHDELARWIAARTPTGRPPLMSDIAAGLSRLKSTLETAADDPRLGGLSRANGKDKKPWPRWTGPGTDGIPLREILYQSVREPLQRSLAYHLPVRAALTPDLPSAWYGQQEAHWIAFYDALRRLGLARYPAADDEQFDGWAALARTTGWWWPGETVCIAVERPLAIQTKAVSNSPHDEVRVASVTWRR